MKKSVVMLLVLMLMVVSVTPSLAAGGPPVGRGVNGAFTLAGTMTAISGTTVTVNVASVSGPNKTGMGQAVVLQTDANTRFLLKTATGVVPITLADLQVGQKVSVSGTIADGVWTASRITVGANLIHYP